MNSWQSQGGRNSIEGENQKNKIPHCDQEHNESCHIIEHCHVEFTNGMLLPDLCMTCQRHKAIAHFQAMQSRDRVTQSVTGLTPSELPPGKFYASCISVMAMHTEITCVTRCSTFTDTVFSSLGSYREQVFTAVTGNRFSQLLQGTGFHCCYRGILSSTMCLAQDVWGSTILRPRAFSQGLVRGGVSAVSSSAVTVLPREIPNMDT